MEQKAKNIAQKLRDPKEKKKNRNEAKRIRRRKVIPQDHVAT